MQIEGKFVFYKHNLNLMKNLKGAQKDYYNKDFSDTLLSYKRTLFRMFSALSTALSFSL